MNGEFTHATDKGIFRSLGSWSVRCYPTPCRPLLGSPSGLVPVSARQR